LPPSMKRHPVFHVCLLEPLVADPFPNRRQPAPPPVHVDGELEYEVASVLDSRRRRGRLEYLIDWVGFDESERSWECASDLGNAAKAVAAFHRQFPNRPK
jgi:hypothetical protein